MVEREHNGIAPNGDGKKELNDQSRADLHLHSTHSDGVYSPKELVEKARDHGLCAISIVDHDNVAATEEAVEWGKSMDVEVVPGLELSVTMGEKDLHVLAYYCDYKNKDLLDYLSFFQLERLKRAERIVEKLNKLDVPLKLDSVLDQAGVGSVGRPHIANALVEDGLIETYHQAFQKFIGAGGPAYEKKYQLTMKDTINLISSAGGLLFLAHPGRSVSEPEILDFIKLGIDGIEVVHPCHSESQRQYYRRIINQYFLLESGGSDFHGGRKGDEETLGEYTVPMSVVEAMRRRLFV